jgi:hypothetical protein
MAAEFSEEKFPRLTIAEEEVLQGPMGNKLLAAAAAGLLLLGSNNTGGRFRFGSVMCDDVPFRELEFDSFSRPRRPTSSPILELIPRVSLEFFLLRSRPSFMPTGVLETGEGRTRYGAPDSTVCAIGWGHFLRLMRWAAVALTSIVMTPPVASHEHYGSSYKYSSRALSS